MAHKPAFSAVATSRAFSLHRSFSGSRVTIQSPSTGNFAGAWAIGGNSSASLLHQERRRDCFPSFCCHAVQVIDAEVELISVPAQRIVAIHHGSQIPCGGNEVLVGVLPAAHELPPREVDSCCFAHAKSMFSV
eukprot:5185029-Amphidinium_carterae.1